MNNAIDLTGKTFGRLTYIKRTINGKHPKAIFKCICGNEKELSEGHVKNGGTKSCGCYRKEKIFKHGLRNHPLYAVWLQMNFRCTSIKCPEYNLYGGRGVTVCKEWDTDFINFYNWCLGNGWRKGLQLDKDIKALKLGVTPILYSPEFCSFVTPKDNLQNTRFTKITYEKATEIRKSCKSASDLAKIYNVNVRTIYCILNNKTWI